MHMASETQVSVCEDLRVVTAAVDRHVAGPAPWIPDLCPCHRYHSEGSWALYDHPRTRDYSVYRGNHHSSTKRDGRRLKPVPDNAVVHPKLKPRTTREPVRRDRKQMRIVGTSDRSNIQGVKTKLVSAFAN